MATRFISANLLKVAVTAVAVGFRDKFYSNKVVSISLLGSQLEMPALMSCGHMACGISDRQMQEEMKRICSQLIFLLLFRDS